MKKILLTIFMTLTILSLSGCGLFGGDFNEEFIDVVNGFESSSKNTNTGNDFNDEVEYLGLMAEGEVTQYVDDIYIVRRVSKGDRTGLIYITINETSENDVEVENIDISYVDMTEQIAVNYLGDASLSQTDTVLFDLSFEDLVDEINKISLDDIVDILIGLGFTELE